MNIRSSQTMGVAEPLPGIFTFHLTFLVSLQTVGGLAEGATPVAKGPRHCGQFCSISDGAACPAQIGNNAAKPTSVSKGQIVSIRVRRVAPRPSRDMATASQVLQSIEIFKWQVFIFSPWFNFLDNSANHAGTASCSPSFLFVARPPNVLKPGSGCIGTYQPHPPNLV